MAATQDSAPQALETAQEAPGKPQERRWEVSLKYNPTVQVVAASAEQAWQAYKTAMGIHHSIHQPAIVEVPAHGSA